MGLDLARIRRAGSLGGGNRLEAQTWEWKGGVRQKVGWGAAPALCTEGGWHRLVWETTPGRSETWSLLASGREERGIRGLRKGLLGKKHSVD